MKNKKLNKALCSVISVFLATNNLAFATNQSSARTHSLPQKIVKKVKDNKIATGTFILGTGLVIAGTIGLVLNSNKEKEVITKIQADEWFERLGGYKNKYICRSNHLLPGMYLFCADRYILFSEWKRNFQPLRCRMGSLSLTLTALCRKIELA